MNTVKYEVLQVRITDTKDIPRAKAVFYGCKKCGGMVSSIPKDNACCECGNICIDKDMNRLWIGDYEYFVLLKKV